MNSKKNITGVILAGGKSSRMGTDKGVLELNGKKIIEHIISSIQPVVDEIIIISNNNNYDYLGLKVYSDIIKECGPLAGIHTALSYSSTEKNLVVSCDIPFINSDLLSYLVNNAGRCEVAIPVHNGNTEPLCAVYSKKCTDRFEELISKNELKMHNVFHHFITKEIFISEKQSFYHPKLFVNINTPAELNKQKEKAL
jgi:molybdopterin-guanine dinucleotide biosynthesis protein A